MRTNALRSPSEDQARRYPCELLFCPPAGHGWLRCQPHRFFARAVHSDCRHVAVTAHDLTRQEPKLSPLPWYFPRCLSESVSFRAKSKAVPPETMITFTF